jgi:hypothetical protein
MTTIDVQEVGVGLSDGNIFSAVRRLHSDRIEFTRLTRNGTCS